MKRSFQDFFLFSKGLCLLTGLILSSCSGYRIKNPGNPFESYKIKSITIPMFVNHSNLAKVSVPLTREIVNLMSSYPGLRIYSGEDTEGMDAILVGIVETPKYRRQTFQTRNEKFTSDKLKTSIGPRREFFVPTSTAFKLNLRLVLIKNPKPLEVKLARSEMAKYLQQNPSKIIINHTLTVDGSFTREAGDTVSSDSPGTVNYSKNKGNFESSLNSAAKATARQFRETVLDVF